MKAPYRPQPEQEPQEPAADVDIDPYLTWVSGVGGPNYFLPGRQHKWIPVFVKLVGTTPAEFAAGTPFFDKDEEPLIAEWSANVKVPDEYTKGPGANDPDSYCAAMTTVVFFDLLDKYKAKVRGKIQTVDLGLPLDTESLNNAIFK